MSYFQQFPSPNQTDAIPATSTDYRFAAPIENDVPHLHRPRRLSPDGSHSFFGRFNKQDDAINSAPQFPGAGAEPLAQRQELGRRDRLGLDARRATWSTPSATATRRSTTTRSGLRDRDINALPLHRRPGFDERPRRHQRPRHPDAQLRQRPVVVKGSHTLKFGTQHAVHPQRHATPTPTRSTTGNANGSWVSGVGQRYMPGGPCPAPADCSGLPAVATAGRSAYGDSFIPLLGIITQTNVVYNYTIDGQRPAARRRRWRASTAPTSTSSTSRTAGTCATT